MFMAKKASKDRVTILLDAAMNGFKLKPVVIGKSANPRALAGCDMDALPVHYYAQKNAWMSTEIIDHWFYFHLMDDIKEHVGDQKVILTLDNAGPHPEDLGLNNDQIKVKFLPPNTTPLIQPMDMGVIYTFKRAYMRIYYNKMMEHELHLPDNDYPIASSSKT